LKRTHDAYLKANKSIDYSLIKSDRKKFDSQQDTTNKLYGEFKKLVFQGSYMYMSEGDV